VVRVGQGRFEVRYTGLSFVDPAAVQFKYRLRGFDREWVEAGGRRTATYTNLPPGRFEFQVVAANNDGVWNETGARLAVAVQAPYYRSHWFWILCAVSAIAIGFAVHQLKVVRMKSRFTAVLDERSRIAREIHDTIMQGVTAMSAQLEAISGTLEHSPPKARAQLERARLHARNIVDESRRSIAGLRPKPLENGNLVTALRASAREMMETSSVNLQIDVSGMHRPLPSEMESNLLRIAQEAIANSLLHGKPARIMVQVRFESQRVCLTVEDDGGGFECSASAFHKPDHYGLVGMRERAEQMAGCFTLQSAPGSGTKVEVSIPVHV
jgi:signal transduction histidine kinase